MSSYNFTPAMGSLATTEADLSGTTVPTNYEWLVDLLLANRTTGSVTYRIALSDGTNIYYRAYDLTLGANSSVDVFKGLAIPATYRIRGRAGAAASIDYLITGRQRPTNL
jgi:secreted protein with Ig-like and vWFA domain